MMKSARAYITSETDISGATGSLSWELIGLRNPISLTKYTYS